MFKKEERAVSFLVFDIKKVYVVPDFYKVNT